MMSKVTARRPIPNQWMSKTKEAMHPANKENDEQGNCEKTDSKSMDVEDEGSDASSDADIDCTIDANEFNKKYGGLQKNWLEGKVNEKPLSDEELKQNGKHSYILQYALEDERVNNKDLVFHPTDSYSYSDYDKNFILPSMSPDKLQAAKQRLLSKIGRKELTIHKMIAEAEQKKADKEKAAAEKEK